MKLRHKFLILLTTLNGLLPLGKAATAPSADSAIQAIQQAPDPSSVIGAYANGFAIDRNNPKLYDAYVSRMVELGLPEITYYQARTLTTLQADNGLAWGVVAYVDARRGQMPEALSAINLAGQFAPDNPFIQRTSGELIAWYDTKADKTQVPENVKLGLAKVRGLLDKRAAFSDAYASAQKAYQSQASTPAQPAPGTYAPAPAAGTSPVTPNALQVPAAPQVPLAPQAQMAPEAAAGYAYAAPAPADYPPYGAPAYYPDDSGAYLDWGPDYYYDWGPGWVAPTPWCWWQPFGFWGGCAFFPFGFSFAFGDFHDFHHFHHDHDFDHHGHFGHDGNFAHGHDPAFWHHDAHGRNAFFGAPAQATASVTHWNHTMAAGHTVGAGQSTAVSSSFRAGGASARTVNRSVGGTASSVHSFSGSSSAFRSDPAVHNTWAGTGGAFRSDPAIHRAWSGQSSGFSSRNFATTRFAAPGGGSFRSFGGAPMGASRPFGSSVGTFHSAGSVNGGFRSGGFNSGGFHGGGFNMGGSHGGGFSGVGHGGGAGGGGFHGGGGGFHGGGGGGHR